MRKRWVVISRDANGREIGRETFWFRRSAETAKRWHDATARGARVRSVLAPRPLFTNDVERAS